MEFQYCSSQPALLHLSALFLQIGQTSRQIVVTHNAPHNPHIQVVALRCAVLSLLRPPAGYFVSPSRYIFSRYRGAYGLLKTPSQRQRFIKAARVITPITHRTMSIV